MIKGLRLVTRMRQEKINQDKYIVSETTNFGGQFLSSRLIYRNDSLAILKLVY